MLKSSERRLALLVLVVSCAYLLLFRHCADLEPDEGILLQGAQRILSGQVLYRDFFSFLTPGSYYFLAILFKIFGNSFLVARTALALMGGIMSLIYYLLARRVCSRWSALVVTGLVTLTALPYRFLVLHNWDSTLCACLALYCAVRWLESGHCRLQIVDRRLSTADCQPSLGKAWAFATGSLAALTFLFEQSKGAGLLLGLGGALLVLNKSKIEPVSGRRKSKMSPTAFCLLAGLVWPFLLTLGYFGAQHSLSFMLVDWLWPLEHYATVNRVPYGYQNWSESAVRSMFFSGSWFERLVTILTISSGFLIPILPLIACVLLVYWFNQMWRLRTPQATVPTQRFVDEASSSADEGSGTGSELAQPQAGVPVPADNKGAYYLLTNATLCGLLLSVVMVRADILHFLYLAPLFYLPLAWVMDGRDIPGSLFRAIRPFLNAYVLVAFGLLSVPLLLRAIQTHYRLETRRGVVAMSARDTVVDYVQAHVPPGEEILVYPYLPLYYYLTETFSPTRYDFFLPGMHTLQQSREMVSELAAHRVEVVLLEISFADKIATSWPGTPVAAIADDPIADFILQNYRTCRVLKSPRGWRFLFMVRKGLACP